MQNKSYNEYFKEYHVDSSNEMYNTESATRR